MAKLSFQHPRMDPLIFLSIPRLTYNFQRNQEGFLQTPSTPQIYVLTAMLSSRKSKAKEPEIILH